MNLWDLFTGICSVLLASSGIFVFFLRDARSILNSEMHDSDEGQE